MIDVKKTLLETIKDRINKLRFLGKNNPAIFKRIIYLILLDDIYDWSNYLDDSQSIQKKLKDLRTNFILRNSEFLIQYKLDQDDSYVNVNTPQTNYTWLRVWDSPNLHNTDYDEITQIAPPTSPGTPFVPDPTCPVSITYFGENEVIPADINGKPVVDFNTLTICEKMNIYINRETGQMFFLDPQTCTWKALKGELASAISWNSIVNAPDIYSNIVHSVNDTSHQLGVTIGKATLNPLTGQWVYGSQTSNTPVTDSDTDPNNNDDLNDVL